MSTKLEEIILDLEQRLRKLEDTQRLRSVSPFIANSLNQVCGTAKRINISDQYYIDADGIAYLKNIVLTEGEIITGSSYIPILSSPSPPPSGFGLIFLDANDGNQPKIITPDGSIDNLALGRPE